MLLSGKRFPYHRLGFLEVLPLFRIEIAQVVVDAGIIWKSLQELLELGLALGVISQIHVDH